MTDASSVKEAIEKVEKSISELSEQLQKTRKVIEQLAEDLNKQMDKTVKQASSVAQEIKRDITTFQEQRQLVESQFTAEVDSAKELSGIKDLEDALRVVIETIDELNNQVKIETVLEAVKQLEAKQKGSSKGGK